MWKKALRGAFVCGAVLYYAYGQWQEHTPKPEDGVNSSISLNSGYTAPSSANVEVYSDSVVSGDSSLPIKVNPSINSWDFQPPAWSTVAFPEYVTLLEFPVDTAFLETQYGVERGSIHYDELDELGRSGIAYGVITDEMVSESAGWREKFESKSEPSGWFRWRNKNSGEFLTERQASISSSRGIERIKNNKQVSLQNADGSVTNGWFYNKSHSIADALGGRAFRGNLTTGTRHQNVGNRDNNGGMRAVEKKALDYLASSDDDLHYFVKPTYVEDELVPRGSLVVMWDTSDWQESYWVFNTARGYTINYGDGTFQPLEEVR